MIVVTVVKQIESLEIYNWIELIVIMDDCDRTSLLIKAIDNYYKDEITSIPIKLILCEFLRLHNNIPLFILCKKCHIKYDKKK